jgi:hypothetical protein
MLSVASVMMKGCGRRPIDIDDPLTAPTSAPEASMASMTRGAESTCWKTSPPTTVASARLAPTDRSMPAGQDHQLLAHRDDGDDGGLGEDVAEIDRLEKVRGDQADEDDKKREDQQGPDAQERQPDPDAGPALSDLLISNLGQCLGRSAATIPIHAGSSSRFQEHKK